MPTYDFACSKCPRIHEAFVAYEQRDDPIPCPNCGKPSRRVWLKAPMGKGDDCDWSSENNGKGRYNPQTCMYHKDRNAVIEEAKKRGWEYSI